MVRSSAKRKLTWIATSILILVIPFSLQKGALWPFFVWAGGLVALFWSIYEPPGIPRRLPSRFYPYKQVALLSLLILSFFLRVYRIFDLPPGLWVDEIYTASNAMELTENGWANPFRMTPLVGPGWVETSNLYLYFVRFIWLLFPGFKYIQVKMVSIIPGVVAIFLLYSLVKRLWGVRAGLAAAFFMAVSSWQITLSRWGWDEVLLTALQIPVFLYLWKGMKKGRIFNFAVAGLFLGLCQYTYAASRIIAAFTFFFLFLECLLERRFFQRNKRNLAFFLIVFVLTTGPLALYFTKHPVAFSSRMKEVSLIADMRREGSVRPLIRNIRLHLGMFHFRGDPNVRHHIPYVPLLDLVSGIFMLIGFIVVVLRIRNPKYRFILLWPALALLGGVLSAGVEAPQSYRTGIAAPGVFALCGVGWFFSFNFFRRRIVKNRQIAVIITIMLFCLAFLLNVQRYFVRYPKTPELQTQFWGSAETEFVRDLNATSEDDDFIIFDATYHSDYFFVLKTVKRLILKPKTAYFRPETGKIYDVQFRKELSPETVSGSILAIPSFRRFVYDELFPGIEWKQIRRDSEKKGLYTETSEILNTEKFREGPDPEEDFPFEIQYYAGQKIIETKLAAEMTFENIPKEAGRIEVHSSLILPNDYHSILEIRSENSATLIVDGMQILTEKDGPTIVPLGAGKRRLLLRINIETKPVETKIYWRPDFEHDNPVPPSFFTRITP